MAFLTDIAQFFCVIFAAIFYIFRLKGRTCNAPRRIRSVQESRKLLRHSSLESRAAPNQRLVTAFGIDNAFTTTESAYHKVFVSKAKDLMRTPNEEWTGLATAASDIIREALSSSVQDEPLFLTKLVQALVFLVVVKKFFPDAASLSNEDVGYITAKINSQWLLSKSCGGQDPVELARERKDLLQKLQPFVNGGMAESRNVGRENPLNIILPAYETLWRVVLSCFLEVRFRADAQDHVRYAQMFDSFSADPNPRTFQSQYVDSSLSIEHIVDEALRLHPPTRRIYRQTDEGVVAVDVEHLHRDPDIWGVDALKFSPNRWIRKRRTKLEYIPFGMGSFECPAKNSFGPMMIGILVGGLVAEIGQGFELVGDGLKRDALSPGPLEGTRKAYAGLQLRRL